MKVAVHGGWTVVLPVLLLVGCTSIRQIGTIGPRDLPVYSIRDTGFLSEGRMLVVINQDGNVGAASGGTVAGPGPLVTNIAGTIIMAGAVGYAAHTLSDAIRGINVTAKGSIKLPATVEGPTKPLQVQTSGAVGANTIQVGP